MYFLLFDGAGICLGPIQARTHVLAIACQQALIHAQRRLRLTMQHVYGHGGNLGNECADHAAALGTFGLLSNHNVANIGDVLERLQTIRTNAVSLPHDRG